LFAAPKEHMRVSGQLRRKSAYADVRQLTLDLESWNENNRYGDTLPIPSFNFDKDLEDAQHPTTYIEDPSDDGDDTVH